MARRLAALRLHLRLARERAAELGRRPRLAYLGGEGAGNLGDDAMLEAARRLLTGAALRPLDHPRREKRLRWLGLGGGAYFTAAVLGGGTLVNPMWFERARGAVELGLPLFTLGTGVGSCGFAQPPEVEIAPWRPLLERCVALGVRGPRSAAALRALGLGAVEVVGDSALALSREAVTPAAEPRRFAVNVTLPPGEMAGIAGHPGLGGLVAGLRPLVAAGWTPVPIAMHADDLPALGWLLGNLWEPNRDGGGIRVCTDPAEFFTAVAPCAFAAGVRLHTAVLACCAGVPPLVLGYRDKCLDFVESMGLEEWYVPLETAAPEEVAARLARLAAAPAGLRGEVLDRARGWRRRLEDYARRALAATMRGETAASP